MPGHRVARRRGDGGRGDRREEEREDERERRARCRCAAALDSSVPKNTATASAPTTTPTSCAITGMSRSVRSPDASPWRNARSAIANEPPTTRSDLMMPKMPGGRDGADADEAHVAAEDLRRRHLRDRHRRRVHRDVRQVLADHPDERHEHEVREDAARDEHHRRPQAHHVAEAEDEGDGVERHGHARVLGERLHRRQELQVHELAPHLEGGHEEVVDAGERRGLEQELRLRAAALAGHEDFGDGGGLGIRELAVRLADEVAPQGNEEQDAQAAAREADEDRLRRVRLEAQRVERRQREDGAGDDGAGRAADPGEDHVLEQRRAAPVDARQADRQDGDRDRGLHHLPDLQPGVRRCHREDDAQRQAPEDRAPRGLRRRAGRRHDRQVGQVACEGRVGVGRQACGLAGARGGRALRFNSGGRGQAAPSF